MTIFKKYIFLLLGFVFFTCLIIYSVKTENLNLPIQASIVLASLVLVFVSVTSITNIHAILVFSVPLSVDFSLTAESKISLPGEGLLLLLILVLAIKVFWGLKLDKKIFLHPITILLLLDIGWSMSTFFLSEFPDVVLKRVFTKFLFFIGFFLVQAMSKSDSKVLLNLPKFYSLGLVIPMIYSAYIHSEWGFSQPSSIHVSEPFYVDHTIYAACLAMVLPFAIIWSNSKQSSLLVSIAKYILVVMLIMSIIFSYSRAAWISLIIAGLFYVAIQFRVRLWQLATILSFVIIVFLINFNSVYDSLKENEVKYDDDVTTHISSVTNLKNDASNLERINRWVCAYRMFQTKPITGYGVGTYQFVYDRFQSEEFMTRISTREGNMGNAHSEYFSSLSESGIVGFVIFVSIVFYSITLALRLSYGELPRENKAIVMFAILGLITFFIHGLFNTFSDIDKLAILLYGFLATLVNIDIKSRVINE